MYWYNWVSPQHGWSAPRRVGLSKCILLFAPYMAQVNLSCEWLFHTHTYIPISSVNRQTGGRTGPPGTRLGSATRSLPTSSYPALDRALEDPLEMLRERKLEL